MISGLLPIHHRVKIYIQELYQDALELGAWSQRGIRDGANDPNCSYP